MKIAPLTVGAISSPMQNHTARPANVGTLKSVLKCDTISFMGKGDKYELPKYYELTGETYGSLTEKEKAFSDALRGYLALDENSSDFKEKLDEKSENVRQAYLGLEGEILDTDEDDARAAKNVYFLTTIVEAVGAISKSENQKLYDDLVKYIDWFMEDNVGKDYLLTPMNFYINGNIHENIGSLEYFRNRYW